MKRRSSAASDRYLWFRPESRWIWFRMAVPKEFQARAGRKLIQFSLETDDRFEASIRAGKKRAELFESWGAVATRRVPTLAELEDAAVAIGHDMIVAYEDARRQGLRGVDGESWRRFVRRTKINLDLQSRLTATGDDALVRGLADTAIEEFGYDLPLGSDLHARFCDLLNKARLAALEVSSEKAAGRVEVSTDSKLVRQVREREAAKAKPGETIMELFEVYASELVAAKKKRAAGVDQDRMVLDVFAEFVGRDRAPSSIAYDDGKEFVDALAKLPAGYKKRGDYRGLTVRQAVERGQAEGHKPLSIITQQRYISTVSPFFKWLQSERGGRRVRQNPFDGLHRDISKIKGSNPRPPFTADQITKIISSPLFTGFLADGKEHVRGNKHADDWRYWLPLICLFSGARIGEAAQLRVDDIDRDHGIWCVEFRHDEMTGQQTKSDKSRFVALHSTLIAIGLPAFVERQKARSEKDGNPQLFPELVPGPRQQYGDEPSAWWRDYLTHIGVKPRDGGGFGSHSFRHTMADQLRAAGHLDHVFGPLILGHSTKSVTGGYGEARQGTPKQSREIIESVKFVPIMRGKIVEGGKPVDFTHLTQGESA